MEEDRIAVVILAWNNCQVTLECLRSLGEQTKPHRVYVVDNASADDTAAGVAAQFPQAHLIVNEQNLGFAGGNNVGLRAAFADGADAVLILNNDTTLDPRALMHLSEAAQTHPGSGILTPAILFASPSHRIWAAGASLNWWIGRSFPRSYHALYPDIAKEIREVAAAIGCAMYITRACFERIGAFDEPLFMYFEDTAYSLRARDAGFSILLVPHAIIYHHVAGSSGAKSPNVVYLLTRNSIVTMDRLRPLPWPLALLRRLLSTLAMVYYIAKPPQAIARFSDIMMGYRDARRQRLGPRVDASRAAR